jgi:hypothetical protein
LKLGTRNLKLNPMSNPLLRSNDPRFQRPQIPSAGQNPFGEDAATTTGDPKQNTDIFAATVVEEAQPYTAQYPVQQRSRSQLLIFLGGISWGAALVGAFSFTGWLDMGWLSPLIGVAPAGAAWFLAHEELKAIRAGAIAPTATQPARHAFWLGVTGLIACLAVVGTMIYRQMNVLPSL